MPPGKMRITCTDKFGKKVPLPKATEACDFTQDSRIGVRDAEETSRPLSTSDLSPATAVAIV